jgi:hypothetical protein
VNIWSVKRATTTSALVLLLLALSGSAHAQLAPTTGLKPPKITRSETTFTQESTGNWFVSTTLRWTKVNGAAVYEVCNGPGTPACASGVVSPYTVEVSGVPPNTTIQYYVIACNADSSVCSQSDPVNVTTPSS